METTLQLIEEKFESQQSGKSDLLIQIGQENISYAIIDKGREQLKALVEYKATLSDLESILQSDRYLRYFYRKIKVVTTTFKFTFIPRDIYSDSEIEHYAKYISPESASNVLVNDIRPFRIKNVMAADADFQQTVLSGFRQPVIFSQANAFIEGAFKIFQSGALFQLNIHILPQRLEIVVLKDHNLLFYNIFESNTPDELNYFLLLTINQFNLTTDNTLVTLAGRIENKDACYERIQKYFDNIRLADPCEFIQCSETFNNIQLHQYFSLLSLNLCE